MVDLKLITKINYIQWGKDSHGDWVSFDIPKGTKLEVIDIIQNQLGTTYKCEVIINNKLYKDIMINESFVEPRGVVYKRLRPEDQEDQEDQEGGRRRRKHKSKRTRGARKSTKRTRRR